MRNMRRLEYFWNGFLMSTPLKAFLNLFKLFIYYYSFIRRGEHSKKWILWRFHFEIFKKHVFKDALLKYHRKIWRPKFSWENDASWLTNYKRRKCDIKQNDRGLLSILIPFFFLLKILLFSCFSYDLDLYNNLKQLILPCWACLIPCSGRRPNWIKVEAALQGPLRRMGSYNISQQMRQKEAYSHHHQKRALRIWRIHRHTLG